MRNGKQKRDVRPDIQHDQGNLLNHHYTGIGFTYFDKYEVLN